MPRKFCEYDRILITTQAYEKVMAWSQSLNEIGFMCFGRENRIEVVVRLANFSTAPRNYFEASIDEKERLMKQILDKEFDFLCEGHSHPSHHHSQRISKTDWSGMKVGDVEIIAFPLKLQLLRWNIKNKFDETVSSEGEFLIVF